MSFRITLSKSARSGVFDCERRKILPWLTAALWCECTQLQLVLRRSWEILQGAAQWAPVERGGFYNWPFSVLTQIRGWGSKVADEEEKSPSIEPRLGFSFKFNPVCVTPTFLSSLHLFTANILLLRGTCREDLQNDICMSCVSPMCEDEGRCLIYSMSRTAAIHCLSSWDIYQTKGHISQTYFPPSLFFLIFL